MGLLLNRAKANTITVGVGAVTPGTAVAPYRTWAASGAAANGWYDYLLEDVGNVWEVGVGFYNGTTITRPGPGVDAHFDSSSGALLNLSGAATVACVANRESTMSGGIMAGFSQPDNTLFGWVNQGTSTVTINANGGIHLRAQASTFALRLRTMAAPATPYTLTACILPYALNRTYQGAGICFRASGSGIISGFGTVQDINALGADYYTNPTTFGSTLVRETAVGMMSGPLWLQILDDGTNRKYLYGKDGYNFIQLASTPRTTTMTANEVGFYAYDGTNVYQSGNTLLSWRLN